MVRFTDRRPVPCCVTAALVLTCYLTACTAWHKQTAIPQQVITAKQPRKVRIARQDGSRVELLQPKIEGDSIVGTTWDVKPGSQPLRTAIALADVRGIEVKEDDTGRTIMAVGFIGGIIALMAALSSGWASK